MSESLELAYNQGNRDLEEISRLERELGISTNVEQEKEVKKAEKLSKEKESAIQKLKQFDTPTPTPGSNPEDTSGVQGVKEGIETARGVVKQTVAGAASAIENMYNGTKAITHFGWESANNVEKYLQEQGIISKDFIPDPTDWEKTDIVDKAFGTPTNFYERAARVGGELAIPFTAFAKTSKLFSGAMTAGNFIKGLGAEAVVDALAFDANDDRLGDVVKNFWPSAPAIATITAHPDNGKEEYLDGMVKNALEGVFANSIVAAPIHAVAALSRKRKLLKEAEKMSEPVVESAAKGISDLESKTTKVEMTPVETTTPIIEEKVSSNLPAIGEPKSIDITIDPKIPITDEAIELSKIYSGDPNKFLEDVAKGVIPEGSVTNFGNIEKQNIVAARAAKAIEAEYGYIKYPKSMETTMAEGQAIASSPEKIQELYQRGNMSYSSSELAALGIDYVTTAENAFKTSESISSLAKNTPEFDKASSDFINYFNHMTQAYMVVRGGMTEAGRSLQAIKFIFTEEMKNPYVRSQMTRLIGEGNIRQAANDFQNIYKSFGQRGANKVIEAVVVKGTPVQDVLREIVVTNLLGGVESAVRNMTGLAELALSPIQESIALKSAFRKNIIKNDEYVHRLAANSEATKALLANAWSELTMAISSPFKAFSEADGIKKGLLAFEDEATSGFKFREGRPKAITSETLGIANGWLADIVDVTGAMQRLQTGPMATMSRWIDGMSTTFKKTQLVSLEANMRGLKGAERELFVSEAMKGIHEQPSHVVYDAAAKGNLEAQRLVDEFDTFGSIDRQAIEFSDKIQYMQEPTPGSLGEDITKIFRRPGLNVLSPFVRNSIAMTQEAINSTFIARYVGPNAELLKRGGLEAEKAMARMKIGNWGLGVGATIGATYGFNWVKEQDNKIFLSTQGIFPDRIGDFDLKQLGIMGDLIGLGASIGKIGAYIITAHPELEDAYSEAVFAATAATLGKVFPEGVAKDVNVLTDIMKGDMESAKSKMVGLGVSAVPFAGSRTFKEAKSMQDPYKRDRLSDQEKGFIHSMLEPFIARMPGVSEDMMPAIDVLGYPILEERGFVRQHTLDDKFKIEKSPALSFLITEADQAIKTNPKIGFSDEIVMKPVSRKFSMFGLNGNIELNDEEYFVTQLAAAGKQGMVDVDNNGKISYSMEDLKSPGKLEETLNKYVEDIQSTEKGTWLEKNGKIRDELTRMKMNKTIGAYKSSAVYMAAKVLPSLKEKLKNYAKLNGIAIRSGDPEQWQEEFASQGARLDGEE